MIIEEYDRPGVQRGAAEPDTVTKKAKIAAFERSYKNYDELGPDTHHADGLLTFLERKHGHHADPRSNEGVR